MNSRQKAVQQAQLDNEKKVLRQLKQVYSRASQDCAEKIRELNSRTDMQNLQSIIYQKQYQEALKKQLDGICDTLQSNQFTSIADYLGTSYEDGFIGTLFDLQGQGIPLIFPIDEGQVVKALQTDTKLKSSLYKSLGEDVDYLKKSIKAELSRGIANGSSWLDIAAHIANGMNSPFNKALKRSSLIARTEGHRIQNQAALDCQHKAKDKGADVLKQWDSTLDKRTRKAHVEADGKIVELDEYFSVGGEEMEAPGVGGTAKNVCNCRCCLLQRVRWALGQDELDKLKERAAYFGLDKSKDFESFKQKYLKLPKNADTMKVSEEKVDVQEVMNNNETVKGSVETLEKLNVQYNPVLHHPTPLSESSIIESLSGGDKTKGSCASVGLAYVGQKNGLNVLDFRGGESQNFFSNGYNLKKIAELPNITKISEIARSSVTSGKKLLTRVEEGNEYYFVSGRHATVVRKYEGVLQYLELQSANRSGWTDFNGNVRYTLANRFGETKGYDCESYMFNVQDANDSKELQVLLGYINTVVDKQKKGVGGSVK